MSKHLSNGPICHMQVFAECSGHYNSLYKIIPLCQYPSPADPHYLSFLKPQMAISGFSHLQPGVLHISLRTHKTQKYNREGGRKEKKKKANSDLG